MKRLFRYVSVAILVVTILSLAQYILAFFVFKLFGPKVLQWIGWGVWLLSVYFGFAPIFIFRRRGGVAKGQSYVNTTRLVDTNLYAIVRHPQYVAGMLFNLALILLSPHWLVIALGLISMVLIYLDIRAADQEGIEKFGDEYKLYMQRVPRANFLLGVVRWLKHHRSKKDS
jgi:protein-S-isoprenylcysteine O-methyltransferase Ste14